MSELGQKIEQVRNTKSTRIWFMVLLVAVVVLLYMLGIIKKGFAIGLGIILLAAIGIETFNYDLDLGRLWETGNIQESRVTHTKDGLKLMGSCALPKVGGEGDLDCNNFKTQAEAQAKYDQCANEIASYNQGVDAAKVKSLDIYGLDRNKNGVVCEALPGTPVVKDTPPPQTDATPAKPATTSSTSKKTNTTTTTTSTTVKPYSTTPIRNSDQPYAISPTTVKTNPRPLQ